MPPQTCVATDPTPSPEMELMLAIVMAMGRAQPLDARVGLCRAVYDILEGWTDATPLGSSPVNVMAALREWRKRSLWVIGGE